MVDPSFWSDSNVVAISRDARLLFIGLWNYADDEGYFIDDLPAIKRTLFPDQDFDIAATFSECRRFVTEYLYTPPTGGEPRPAYKIAHFLDWQSINRPTPSKIAPFCKLTDDSLRTHGALIPKLSKVSKIALAPKARAPRASVSIGQSKKREGDSAGARSAMATYRDLFVAKFDAKPDIVGGRDGKILSDLVKSHGAEQVIELLHVFFESPPKWVEKNSKFTIPAFKSAYTEILAQSRNGKVQMGVL